jgi:hypothetical protein
LRQFYKLNIYKSYFWRDKINGVRDNTKESVRNL